ncbi:MAG: hypothetical protein ABSF54_20135, partial [Bryobacteraceae bacterium]
GPLALSVMVGIGLKVWLPTKLANEIGDALIVAGLVGILIEIWGTSILIEHVSKQLSERLVGYGLPKPAQAVIGALVHDTRIILRNYKAVFRIDPNPDKPDYVIVRLTLTYTALNNGMRTEPYGPMLSEELIYNPRLELLEYADKSYSRSELVARRIEGTQLAWESPKVPLEPSEAAAAPDSLGPEQAVNVRWVYLMDMPIRYSAVLSFATVVIDPEIQFDPSPTGPTFKFESNPHESLRHAANGLRWEYKRAFIRDQAIRVWWEPQASTGE